MALIDRITRLFRREDPLATTTHTPPRQHDPIAAMLAGNAGGGRLKDMKQSRRMYKEDPRAKAILSTLSRDATKGGFILETSDTKALEAAESLRARLDLDNIIDDWVRLTFRDGDSFLEVGVNENREIALVTRKQTENMHRDSNAFDHFENPSRAFWYADQSWKTQPDTDTPFFAYWQIVHARWDHDSDARYGTPLLAASITPWNYVRSGERDMAVRRRVRASQRYLHKLANTDAAGLEAYMNLNAEALNAENPATLDFFMSGDGDIKAIAGDGAVGETADIMHHLHAFWLSSPVPMALLGYGQDIDFSVIGHQKTQYDETLSEVRTWVAESFIKPLIERQWLLDGILPEHVTYKISWRPKHVVTPEMVEKIARAGMALQQMGMAPGAIARLLSGMLPDVDPEEILTGLTAPGSTNESQRLANITDVLAGKSGVFTSH